MSTKSKYRKLNLGPSEPLTRRNSVQGMFVMADYIDPLNNQRTLLLERQGTGEVAATPKPKHKRKVRTNSNASPQTSFDTSAMKDDLNG